VRRLAVACLLLAGAGFAAAADTAGGDPPLPRTAVVSPPPSHRADPSLRTYVARVGPFEIGGYGVIKRDDRVTAPPEAGSIVAMDARIVDARGAAVAQNVVMLHHFLMTNGGRDGRRHDSVCPHRPVNERFYGTSEELRAMTFPRGYGYPTDPLDRWRMIWMVMNHRHADREIYIEYRVTVDPRPLTPVTPLWMSVLPCGPDSQYSVAGAGSGAQRRPQRYVLPVGGRIVAIGGHLHGGGLGLRVGQPRCGDRELATARPTYAPADDPLYQVKPLLHEPDPKSMSWWQSAGGWPVVRGEPLKITALYDAKHPHMRVMGIAHVYVAVDPAANRNCASPPADTETLGPEFGGGRRLPPQVRLTLARVGANGLAHELERPRGATRVAGSKALVAVHLQAFAPANLSIAAGGVVRWAFRDHEQHDVTVVTGPRGFAAEYSRRGADYRRRFTVPGRYELYCSLHPTRMSQIVEVRPRRSQRS
jgi:plastocyanin